MQISRGIIALLLGWLLAIGVGAQEIHEAIRNGSSRKVKELLQANPKLLVQTNDETGDMPLHLAAFFGRTNILALILEMKPPLEATNAQGMTALNVAACKDNSDVILMLLKSGAKIDPATECMTPLQQSAADGYIDNVRALLDHGASVNAHQVGRETALAMACSGGRSEIVDLLLAHGADVNALDWLNSTPLIKAAVWGHAQIIQTLIAKGAKVDAMNDSGYSALLLAVREGQTNAVKQLLESKANIDLEDALGHTALGWCRANPKARHSSAMAALLQQYGAVKTGSGRHRTSIHVASGSGDAARVRELLKEQPNLVNKQDSFVGMAPLHRAADSGQIAIAEILLEAGADVNVRDRTGFTPLHNAVKSGNQKMVAWLLSKKADVNARDGEQRTPLHTAAFSGRVAVIKLLLDAGADINARDKRNTTALDYARGLNQSEAADYLVKHGGK